MSRSIQSTSATSRARHSGWPVIRPGRDCCARERPPGSRERTGLWVDLHRAAASMVIFASPPELPEAVIQSSTDDRRGTAQFTPGRHAGNPLDPNGPVETRLVTIDSLVGERPVLGRAVVVEAFEFDVLRRCTRTPHQADAGRVERDVALGARSRLPTRGRPACKQGYCSLSRRDA
jgi:hypothetical protein